MFSEGASRWINVARVANLAEAGFLADELSGEGIDVRIYQSEDFSAVVERWTTSYLIQTPPGDAHAAAALIRSYLADMESGLEPDRQRHWEDGRPVGDPAAWRPMALIVLAGMASFVIGQKFAESRDQPRPPRESLSRAVSAIGRPLVTEPQPGKPRHRLYYQFRERAWYLETDADADGRFESRRRFHAAGAGW